MYRGQILDIPLFDAADYAFAAPSPILRAEAAEPAPRTMGLGLGLSRWAPAALPAPEEALPAVTLQRAPANQLWDGESWVATEVLLAGLALQQGPAPVAALPAPEEALPTVTLQRAPANQLWDGESWVATDSVAGLALQQDFSQEEDVLNRLRLLRADLQTQQDEVYSGETRSHDEMAAQDQEFDELDRKIMAIEQLLTSFRSFFRTR
jgi:hypothetical protein